MFEAERPPAASRSRSYAQLQRDAAIARIVRARRWLILGAAGLTGGISALVAAVAPGHSLASRAHAAAVRARPATTTPHARMPPLKSASQLGLQGPAQAPQSAPAPQQPQPQAAPAPQQAQPQPAPSSSSAGSSSGGGAVSGGS